MICQILYRSETDVNGVILGLNFVAISGHFYLLKFVTDILNSVFWLQFDCCMSLYGVLLKTGPRPMMARRPSPDFPPFFCPAVNPCACTGLHRVWACKMDDGEFEFVYHYNIKQSFRSFHSLHVAT